MEDFNLEMLEQFRNIDAVDVFAPYVRKVVQFPLYREPKKLFFLHTFHNLDVVSPSHFAGKEIYINIICEPYENYLNPDIMYDLAGNVFDYPLKFRRHKQTVRTKIEFEYDELDSVTPLKVFKRINSHLKENIIVLSDDPTFQVLYGKK